MFKTLVLVRECLNGTAPGYAYLSELCVPLAAFCFRSSAFRVSFDGSTASSQSPNHDGPAELRCRGLVIVEQSCCCSAETGDNAAYRQSTNKELPVPSVMSRRTEVTFRLTAR